MRHVVDASVVAGWYFEEELTPSCERLLVGAGELLAPDLLHFEIARLLHSRVASGALDETSAERILAELRLVPFELTPAPELAAAALALARRATLSVADGFYVALALQAACPLVTGDRVLYDRLRASTLASHVIWVGDLS
jgi:predicted nucleic acid-binding protein